MKIEDIHPDFELKPAGAEGLTLEALVRLGEKNLFEGKILEKALRSSLYRRLWRRIDIGNLKTGPRETLRELPFTDRRHILESQKRRALRSLACAPVWMWFASSAEKGEWIWVPYGREDILRILGLMIRLSSVCEIECGDRVLSALPMAPRIANALPYMWMYADMVSSRRNLEFITGSTYMLDRSDWPEFAQRRKPTVMLAGQEEATALLEYYKKTASAPPREILPDLKRGVIPGPVPGSCRRELEEAYGMEIFTCFLSVEFPGLFSECRVHDGCHVWMDTCIPELIPHGKNGRGNRGGTRSSDAIFLDQADVGMQGELVLTTFGEALPLIRYRTGHLIKVTAVSPCSCGITHPRVEFRGAVS